MNGLKPKASNRQIFRMLQQAYGFSIFLSRADFWEKCQFPQTKNADMH